MWSDVDCWHGRGRIADTTYTGEDNDHSLDPDYKQICGNWICLKINECTSPYPKSELEDARHDLIDALQKKGDKFWMFNTEETSELRAEKFKSKCEFKSKCKSELDSADAFELVSILKCDFCDFFHKISDEEKGVGAGDELVVKHLSTFHHSSASTYKAKLFNDDIERLISVENMITLEDRNSRQQSLIVFCPGCYSIFDNIFQCGVHYTMVHESGAEKYAIGPIFSRSEIHLSAEPECLECHAIFDRHKHLHDHWKSNIQCLPYEIREKGTMLLWQCSLCKFKTKSFILCKLHLIKHFSTLQVKPAIYSILMMRILCRVPVRVIPPRDSPVEDQIKSRIDIIRSLPKNQTKSTRAYGSKAFYKREADVLQALLNN